MMRRSRGSLEYEGAAGGGANGWRCEDCAELKLRRCLHRGRSPLTDAEERALADEAVEMLRRLEREGR